MAIDSSTIFAVSCAEEVARVVTLARTIWTQHYTPIIGSKQVQYMLAKFQSTEAITSQLADGYMYYLLHTKDDLGYLSIKSEGNALFLSKIYLLHSQRGKGYGKEMMHFAVKYAKAKNLRYIRLTVNKYNYGSIAAYEKMGFIKKRDVVFDIGQGYIMDDYEMILNLASFYLPQLH